MIKPAIQFIKDAYSELKKVTWLSKKEMIASTAVVVILVAIVAVFVSFVDFIFGKLLSFFI